jgi:hypothetical protein
VEKSNEELHLIIKKLIAVTKEYERLFDNNTLATCTLNDPMIKEYMESEK